MPLYLILLVASLAVPLLLSFNAKVYYYKQFKYLIPAIFIVAAFYIICDVILTKMGVRGFNSAYHSSISMLGLPIEEWLFFIVIPFSSIFLHETLISYFPKVRFSNKATHWLSLGIIIGSLIVAFYHLDQTYTVYISILTALTLMYALKYEYDNMRYFYSSFMLILIPFTIVNGILTGYGIDGEVVWYNNNENLGLRFFTIPLEDFAYALSMLVLVVITRNKLKTLY